MISPRGELRVMSTPKCSASQTHSLNSRSVFSMQFLLLPTLNSFSLYIHCRYVHPGSIVPQHIYIGDPSLLHKRFSLSLYQQLFIEEIPWNFLRRKIYEKKTDGGESSDIFGCVVDLIFLLWIWFLILFFETFLLKKKWDTHQRGVLKGTPRRGAARDIDELPVIQDVPSRPGQHRVIRSGGEPTVLAAAAAGRRLVAPE